MSFDPDRPYNNLPLLPPKPELETKAVLRKAIAANKALAELKGAGDLIPNQGVLINAIILQEAKLLSEIENVVTTNHELVPRTHLHMFAKRLGEYVQKSQVFGHIPETCPSRGHIGWALDMALTMTDRSWALIQSAVKMAEAAANR
jgi:hypothetical protein